MTDIPEWLRSFAEAVCDRVLPALPGGPEPEIACHCTFAEGVWELTLFLDRTEVVGGAADGAARTTPYFLDLHGLDGAFDAVERFAWQPVRLGEADDLGPHVAVEGAVGDHTVWLRFLSDVPRQFGGGRFSALYEG